MFLLQICLLYLLTLIWSFSMYLSQFNTPYLFAVCHVKRHISQVFLERQFVGTSHVIIFTSATL